MNERIEKVYQRVAMYKITHGVTYKDIAKGAGLTKSVIEKFTGKSRRITEENLNKLVTYLDSIEK